MGISEKRFSYPSGNVGIIPHRKEGEPFCRMNEFCKIVPDESALQNGD
jgi:hypothetical protein